MLKSMLAAAAAVFAFAPIASQASNQKHGLQWHYVGNPYSSCSEDYRCNGMRELEIWFTYPAANWENYKINKTDPPCTRLAIPTGGFCLHFTQMNLMQGTASLWSFDAHSAITTIDGYNNSGFGWSFSITVASDSLGNLAFGDGWVMSASNNIYSVISDGNNNGGAGGKDEVKDINGGYDSNERNPGTWTDPPVDIVTPDAVLCNQTKCPPTS